VTKRETLTFERIDQRRRKAELEFDWYSDDIDVDPKPFEFVLEWK
jgi:hypothetical protein